jgi:hypothetical protein
MIEKLISLTKFGWIGVMIFTLLLSACEETETANATESTYSKITQPGDYKKSNFLNVYMDARQVEFQIDTELTCGSITWMLRDPNDVIQWEGYANSFTRVMDEHIIENPLPGSWRLECRLEDAAGEYSTSWIVK